MTSVGQWFTVNRSEKPVSNWKLDKEHRSDYSTVVQYEILAQWNNITIKGLNLSQIIVF